MIIDDNMNTDEKHKKNSKYDILINYLEFGKETTPGYGVPRTIHHLEV